MDIQQVNSVLNRAIMGLQDGELEAMAEAMAVGRTSYQVPAPGKVGPRPKRSRPRSGKGWSRGTFDMIVSRPKPRAPGEKIPTFADVISRPYVEKLDPVRADIRGVWAVHKIGFWQISHAPTGMKIPFEFDNKEEARRAVDLWVEEIPALLWLGKDAEPGEKDAVKAGIIAHRARMKDLIEKAQQQIRDEDEYRARYGGPTPKEKKKMGPPVKVGGTQWRKAAFEKDTTTGKVVTPAVVRGTWAVHKGEKGASTYSMKKGWLISHAPSGLVAFGGFSSQKKAKEAVDAFIDDDPRVITAGKTATDGDSASAQVSPFLKRMRPIARKHGAR